MANLRKSDLRWTLAAAIKRAEGYGAVIWPDAKAAAKGDTADGMWELVEMIREVERSAGRAEMRDGS